MKNIASMLSLTVFYAGFTLADNKGPDVAPISNAGYAKECGACHFAYQPGLLPARSWDKLFSNLQKHFNENAELDDATTRLLREYAMNNAADRVHHKRSVKIAQSIAGGDTPLRISETPYIKKKHHEIPDKMLSKNPKVGSLAKCEACHREAAHGSFSEHGVDIPGFGRWE